MRPFSRCRVQRRRMNGSATVSMRNRRLQARLAMQTFEGFLEGQTVQDGGEHAHVVGSRLLDDLATGAELSAAENVAAADDDGQLHAAHDDALGLPRDVQRFVDADAAFAGIAESLAAQLEDDAAILWP